MKRVMFQKLRVIVASLVVISMFFTACKKESAKTVEPPVVVHDIDARLVGNWLWTQGSTGAYFDNNGVYVGPAYGLAAKYSIRADGFGTSFHHLYSTIGTGSSIEVNIAYSGFYESDNQQHMGFFPTSGTYKSTSGENRALRPDELWNTQTNTGKSFLHQNLTFTTVGGRECFQVTASNGVVDTWFKIP